MSEIVLSHNQKRAITALLEHKSIVDAAEACGLSDKTIRRYMSESSFRVALIQCEGERLDLATRRLLSLSEAAITTLEESMDAEKCLPSVRLRAAQAVLDYLLKLRELRNIEQRIADLEVTIYGKSR